MTGKLIHKKVVFSPFQKLLITAIDTILVHAFRAKRHGQMSMGLYKSNGWMGCVWFPLSVTNKRV